MKKTLLSTIPIIFSILFLSIYNTLNGKPITGSDSALPEPYAMLIIPIIFGGLALPVIVSVIETRQMKKKDMHKENKKQEQKTTHQDTIDLKKYYDVLEIKESSSSIEINIIYHISYQ